MTEVRFEFGSPRSGFNTRSVETKQGGTLLWTVPHGEFPLSLNGINVGYVEVHLHTAWAPDGVPDVSFGFTGRVNTLELLDALGYKVVPKDDQAS